MTWADDNHRRWKAKTALRLVYSRPESGFVNPYPCAVGLVPLPERDQLRKLDSKARAEHFLKKHWPDDPSAA